MLQFLPHKEYFETPMHLKTTKDLVFLSGFFKENEKWMALSEFFLGNKHYYTVSYGARSS